MRWEPNKLVLIAELYWNNKK